MNAQVSSIIPIRVSDTEIEGRIAHLVQQRDGALQQAVMLAGRIADLESRLSKMMMQKSDVPDIDKQA